MEFKEITNKIIDFSNQPYNYKLLFFSTAIAGEVGVYCNLIKKIHRGIPSFDIYKKYFIPLIEKELADIFIYLELNARMLNINLEKAILDKINLLQIKQNLSKKDDI